MTNNTLSARLAFASFAIQTLLCGLFLAVSLLSLFLLRRRARNGHARSARPKNTLILVNSCALIFCVVAHWISSFVRILVAFFIWHDGQDPVGYLTTGLTMHAIPKGFLLLSIVIWDFTMTCRLLIIFNGRKVVLFLPAALFVGFLVCAAGVLVRLFKHDPMTLHTRGGHWIVSDYALSLSMNIYNTSMITWRILRQAKQTRRSGGPSISISLAIFIESAAIGIFHGFFFLGTYLAQHPSHGFAVDTAPAVYGLALAFINLRVAIGIPQKACATGDLSEIAFAQDLQRPALNVVIPLNQRGSHAEWESSQVQFDNKSPTATRV